MKNRKNPDKKVIKLTGWSTFWNDNFKPVIFVSLISTLVVLADEKDLRSSDKRKIILVADDEKNPVLTQQIRLLQRDSIGLTERDIIIETKTDTRARRPFTFILLGKDGTEQFRSYIVQSPGAILNLIDELLSRKPVIKRET